MTQIGNIKAYYKSLAVSNKCFVSFKVDLNSTVLNIFINVLQLVVNDIN